MKTRFFGRLFRFCLGLFFMIEVVPVYINASPNGIILRLGWTLGLVLFYLALHIFIITFVKSLNKILGALLAFVPVLTVFFIGYGGPLATSALTFLSLALLVAAIRSDPGCEVMSIPALFTNKHTHLACLLFSPVDWIEKTVIKVMSK